MGAEQPRPRLSTIYIVMNDREAISRLGQFVKPYRSWLIAAMLSMVMVSLMSAAQAYMLKPLIDEIFIDQDYFMLQLLPVALVLLFLVKGVFDYSSNYLLQKVGQSVVRDLRYRFYSHVQSLPLAFFNKTPTGELISRVISDVTLIQGAVSNVLVGLIRDFFMVLFLLGVLFYQDWQLSLISITCLPILFFPIILFGRKHRKLSTDNQQTTALVSNILYETITGNRIVKAFCMEKEEVRRFGRMLNKLYSIIIHDARIYSLAHPLMEFFGGIGIALVLWYGGNQVLQGNKTPGTFFSFLAALIMIYQPFKGVSKVNSMLQQGVAASIRVFSVLDVRVGVAEKDNAIDLPPIHDGICLDNVSFSYDGNAAVLKDINLQVRAGEVLAIVGSSGGGKTSLVNLLPRFCDVTGGSIRIDGIDIRDVTLHSLRQQIGMVTQQTILFNETVRNNIAYGSKDVAEEEIVAAARAAHAYDFIMGLPEGFDTIIGESGARLSGGERQRISIARALLKNAPILILDEATSSLDTESEREVQKALENLMQDRTTFVIAHRLSTIRRADRIIVIQEGRIVEEGTHDTLLSANGVYKMLHDMQFDS